MSDREQMLDILRKAYQIEVDGYTFYSMTADRAEKEAVRDLFAKLAADEVQHQAYLKSVRGPARPGGRGRVPASTCARRNSARSTRRCSPHASASRRRRPSSSSACCRSG